MTRASDTAKLLGAGATILDGTTISTADNTAQLTLTSTDADGSRGPQLALTRTSASPADNDLCGVFKINGKNDAAEDFELGEIVFTSTDVSNGSEDSKITINGIVAGASAGRLNMTPSEAVFNEDSLDIDFRVETNGNANTLFVDGGTDKVYIGRNESDGLFAAALQVEGNDGNYGAISLHRNGGVPYFGFSASGSASLGDDTLVSDGDALGVLYFSGADGTDRNSGAASIAANVDGTPGANDMPGRLIFSTTADGGTSPTERMRILSTGDVAINSTSSAINNFSAAHLAVNTNSGKNSIIVANNRQNQVAYGVQADNATGSRFALYILNSSGGEAGKISYTNTAVTYATSSDYRLKESITYDFDATTRLKQLKPCRFNFISDETNTLVDGFLAHEVSSIVPEAIVGEKDAMFEEVLYVDGDEIPDGKKVGDVKEASKIAPQSIDQSKLVPLLVKTIQELEARITTLENA